MLVRRRGRQRRRLSLAWVAASPSTHVCYSLHFLPIGLPIPPTHSSTLLQVAHVHIPHAKLLCTERLSAADLEAQCSSAGGGSGVGSEGGASGGSRLQDLARVGLGWLQEDLLQRLGDLPPGQYLLAHAPREPTACLYKALPPELQAHSSEVRGMRICLCWGLGAQPIQL